MAKTIVTDIVDSSRTIDDVVDVQRFASDTNLSDPLTVQKVFSLVEEGRDVKLIPSSPSESSDPPDPPEETTTVTDPGGPNETVEAEPPDPESAPTTTTPAPTSPEPPGSGAVPTDNPQDNTMSVSDIQAEYAAGNYESAAEQWNSLTGENVTAEEVAEGPDTGSGGILLAVVVIIGAIVFGVMN
jgi:hypothetical protein